MAFVNGYVIIPHDTYLAWKTAVNGNGYNADGYYGCQCWDLTAEFWYNVGFPQGYPHTGPNHYAEECWDVSRYANASYNGTTYFDLITSINDVKQGDVIVWNGTTAYPTGHIAFADEDYDRSGYIAVLGQNQGTGGTPPPVFHRDGGSTANVKRLSVSNFAGAFRYRDWQHTPPTPTPTVRSIPKQKRFPWVLYANKLRNKY
jgi:hypothetical protein